MKEPISVTMKWNFFYLTSQQQLRSHLFFIFLFVDASFYLENFFLLSTLPNDTFQNFATFFKFQLKWLRGCLGRNKFKWLLWFSALRLSERDFKIMKHVYQDDAINLQLMSIRSQLPQRIRFRTGSLVAVNMKIIGWACSALVRDEVWQQRQMTNVRFFFAFSWFCSIIPSIDHDFF